MGTDQDMLEQVLQVDCALVSDGQVWDREEGREWLGRDVSQIV